MPETDIRTLISVESDDKGIKSAQRELDDIIKSQEDLVKQFKKGDVTVRDFNREMNRLERDARDISKSIDRVTDGLEGQAKAADEASDKLKNLSKSHMDLADAQDAFDRTSSDVSLSGDFESGLRTVSGGIGVAGFGGIEKIGSGGAEIFAVIEALPKMQAAAAGLPATFNAAAQSMGTSQLALGGLIAGFAALAAAAKIAGEAAKRRVSINEALLNAEQQRNDFELQSTEQLIADLQRKRQEAQLAAEDQEYAAEVSKQFREELGLLGQALLKFGQLFGIGNELQVVEQDEAAAAATTAGLEREIEITEDILKSRGENVDSLKANASAAEETAESFAELTSATGSTMNAARDASKAERERAKAIAETAKASRFAGRPDPKRPGFSTQALSLSGFLNLGRKPEEKQAAKDAADERAELMRQFQEDELELRKDMAEQRYKLELDNFHAIQDSMRDFKRSREDALASGDFLGLRDIKKEEMRAAEDRKIDLKRANDEITRDANKSRRELQAQTSSAMQELNDVVGSGLRTVVQQFRASFADLARMSRGGSRRSPASFGGLLSRAPRGG